MTDQKQTVYGTGDANQANRDIIINNGPTIDIAAIIVGLSEKIAIYREEARRDYDESLREFREEIEKRFEDANTSDKEAFRTVNFQLAVHDAAKAYTSTDDEDIRKLLIELVARRSTAEARSRAALALNEAMIRVSQLSPVELNALALAFIIRKTFQHNVTTELLTLTVIRNYWGPFVFDPDDADACAEHLVATGCGYIEAFHMPLIDAIHSRYGGAICSGLPLDKITGHRELPSTANISQIFLPTSPNSGLYKPNATSQSDFIVLCKSFGIEQKVALSLWELFREAMPSEGKLITALDLFGNSLGTKLFRLWDDSALKHFRFTNIGLAIGHAHAVSTIKMDLDIDTFIR